MPSYNKYIAEWLAEQAARIEKEQEELAKKIAEEEDAAVRSRLASDGAETDKWVRSSRTHAFQAPYCSGLLSFHRWKAITSVDI